MVVTVLRRPSAICLERRPVLMAVSVSGMLTALEPTYLLVGRRDDAPSFTAEYNDAR